MNGHSTSKVPNIKTHIKTMMMYVWMAGARWVAVKRPAPPWKINWLIHKVLAVLSYLYTSFSNFHAILRTSKKDLQLYFSVLKIGRKTQHVEIFWNIPNTLVNPQSFSSFIIFVHILLKFLCNFTHIRRGCPTIHFSTENRTENAACRNFLKKGGGAGSSRANCVSAMMLK